MAHDLFRKRFKYDRCAPVIGSSPVDPLIGVLEALLFSGFSCVGLSVMALTPP
jgi:hypothetical protein